MQGYALLCVGYPLSDLEVETQDEDEVKQSTLFITLKLIVYNYYNVIQSWECFIYFQANCLIITL